MILVYRIPGQNLEKSLTQYCPVMVPSYVLCVTNDITEAEQQPRQVDRSEDTQICIEYCGISWGYNCLKFLNCIRNSTLQDISDV